MIFLFRWKNKQFGEHTFVKRMARGRRPVGATHAGSRPKTAPVTAREKWKTDKVRKPIIATHVRDLKLLKGS